LAGYERRFAMQLSVKDRLVLANQYEILKRLDKDNVTTYEQRIKILVDGYEIFYSDLVTWYSEMSSADSNLVLDILSMYRAIETYKQKNPHDKDITEHHYGHFLGFDGDSEGRALVFAKFLIVDQDKFSEQLEYRDVTDNFNSHWPVIGKYSGMVDKWKELGEEYELSRESVLAVLNA
jgi:uncharacterized protein YfbU (UPF0304 family)